MTSWVTPWKPAYIAIHFAAILMNYYKVRAEGTQSKLWGDLSCFPCALSELIEEQEEEKIKL